MRPDPARRSSRRRHSLSARSNAGGHLADVWHAVETSRGSRCPQPRHMQRALRCHIVRSLGAGGRAWRAGLLRPKHQKRESRRNQNSIVRCTSNSCAPEAAGRLLCAEAERRRARGGCLSKLSSRASCRARRSRDARLSRKRRERDRARRAVFYCECEGPIGSCRWGRAHVCSRAVGLGHKTCTETDDRNGIPQAGALGSALPGKRDAAGTARGGGRTEKRAGAAQAAPVRTITRPRRTTRPWCAGRRASRRQSRTARPPHPSASSPTLSSTLPRPAQRAC
jgi:hypothetical protein